MVLLKDIIQKRKLHFCSSINKCLGFTAGIGSCFTSDVGGDFMDTFCMNLIQIIRSIRFNLKYQEVNSIQKYFIAQANILVYTCNKLELSSSFKLKTDFD